MNAIIRRVTLTLAIAGTCCLPGRSVAHNVDPSPWIVPSLGVVAATAITIDADDVDWPGSATSFAIADYGTSGGSVSPVSANAKALHKADGVYIFLEIDDGGSINDNDLVQIRFDVNHNGTPAVEATDWGIQVLRNGQATWGNADQDVGSWSPVPGGEVAVTPAGSDPWSIEMRIPSGATTGIDLTDEVVGVHFMIYDVDQVLGLNNAKYTQWPAPTAMASDGLNTLFGDSPSHWGNYEFDLATTFPDVSVTEVRNVYDGPENYRKISHMADNVFEVTVNNPGGTAVPEPSNVRLNLYLAARGIGESWHRIDTESLINDDCAAADWASTVIAESDVCSGSSSLDDISAQSINDIVANTAKYTVKEGDPMERLGGTSATLDVGSTPIDVLKWNTTPAQDDRYTEVEVDGTIYRRQHQCMKAEAIVPGDPNPSNNIRQVNMDFVCVPGAQKKMFGFSLGWAGFAQYDANIGKEMLLTLATHNINPQHGWKFAIESKGVKQINEQAWMARIRGKQSLPVEFAIVAPHEERLGKPIKRNLMVPPKAGGDQPYTVERSGQKPVYVKVSPASTIQVVNYSFEHNDEQFVDLDGEGKVFRANGPAGFNPAKPFKRLDQRKLDKRRLVAPKLPAGALIGSFDNFKNIFLVAEGVQVNVPETATHLALGINDFDGMYGDNGGTGFRVKVMEVTDTKNAFWESVKHAASSFELISSAHAMSCTLPIAQMQAVKPVPIQQVMPTVCLQGYEPIGQTRVVGDDKRELYRFVGDVCWGLLNVYDAERSHKPGQEDRSDPFEEDQPHEKPGSWKRIFE